MRIAHAVSAILLFLPVTYAEDEPAVIAKLTTLDGRAYDKVVVTLRTPAYLGIRHETGATRILLSDLSENLRNQYGYDPKTAKAFIAKEKANAQLAEKAAAAQEKALIAKQAAEAKEAEKAAADRKKADAEKMRIDALIASGQEMEFIIMQTVKGGFLVNNVDYDTVSGSASDGSGGGVAVVRRTGNKVFFISAYPPKKGGRPDGESIKGNFVEDGTYSYSDTQGANRTVKKFIYIGEAKPSAPKAPKAKPWTNPLRDKPRRL